MTSRSASERFAVPRVVHEMANGMTHDVDLDRPARRPMRELRLRARLRAPADEVYRWVTEPERMNRWSEAKIEGTSAETRTVRVRAFGMTSRLDEEIVERDPPRRFVYRVVKHATIRDHLGVLELTPDGSETDLVWTVRFRAVLPGLAPLLAAILEPALRRSLEALARELAA